MIIKYCLLSFLSAEWEVGTHCAYVEPLEFKFQILSQEVAIGVY